MKNKASCLLFALIFVALVAGCATTQYQYREPTYTQPIEKGLVLRAVLTRTFP